MWIRIATAALFAAYLAALVWQARVVGVTYDEPAHLAAGYMYWRGEDRLKPSDAPPLTRLVQGWFRWRWTHPCKRTRSSGGKATSGAWAGRYSTPPDQRARSG